MTREQLNHPDGLRQVALIFDDGPIDGVTTRFLELLARENIRVTFAHIGHKALAQPQLVQAVQRAGHEIVNHSFTHPRFTTLDDPAIGREVEDTQETIRAQTGIAPRWFWVPYGAWDERVAAAVKAAGLSHFPMQHFRLVSTEDWNPNVSAEEIYRRATTGISSGSVILFHEWRQETFELLPRMIAELRRQGCAFLTLTELDADHSRNRDGRCRQNLAGGHSGGRPFASPKRSE